MRMDKLTSKLQEALGEAQSLAVGRDHSQIEPLHVLQALLDQEAGSARHLIEAAGVDVREVRNRLIKAIENLPTIGEATGEVPPTQALGRRLNLADKLSQQRGDAFISSELFLLAALEDKGDSGRILKEAGVTPDNLTAAIDKLRGGENVNDANAEEQRG